MHRVRTTAVAAAVAIALLGGAALIPMGASATTTPHLTVTPVSGLKNGSIVKISGTGFKAGDTVFIVQCIWKAKGQAGCKVPLTLPPSKTITSTGRLPLTKFKVMTGKIGNGTCGTKAVNLKNCEVSVGNATGGDSAVARIQFVLPKA